MVAIKPTLLPLTRNVLATQYVSATAGLGAHDSSLRIVEVIQTRQFRGIEFGHQLGKPVFVSRHVKGKPGQVWPIGLIAVQAP